LRSKHINPEPSEEEDNEEAHADPPVVNLEPSEEESGQENADEEESDQEQANEEDVNADPSIVCSSTTTTTA
jgi:hypothetical protein